MMDTRSGFIDAARHGLSAFALAPLNIDPGLNQIQVPGGSLQLECYTADGVEKIVLCTIVIEATSVVESSVLVWPAAGYDLPVLWCNLTRVPQVMTVAIVDVLPVMDPVLWPERAMAAVEGVRALRTHALARLGETVVDPAVMLPSRALYALSPYHLCVDLTDAGLSRLTTVVDDYLRAYHALWQQASRLADPLERDHSVRRGRAIRALMKANDPGFPFMVKVFGEETTRRIFDAVF